MTNDVLCPPPVLWAQKREDVFLTFDIETKDPDIKIEKSSVFFKGINVRDNKIYEVTIPLHDAVIPEKSNFVNKGRCIEMALRKEKTSSGFWPSLTNDKKKPHYLKIDFNKWCDEDNEEPEEEGQNYSDFMDLWQNMGDKDAGGKKPSFDDLESDSDDENLPDLE
ncbi:prostaglandin E synthase 3 homolog [Battus philenor]|uniref:prostaglandin E synthase 3 homolog n=1 Tax=Battus philenor TaxID=42288 RepID=UPI0035D111CA